MEMTTKNQVMNYLVKMGYSQEAARLYVALKERGPLTFLQASRHSGVERTRLYRLAEELIKRGLVVEVMAFKSKKLQAASINQIEKLLDSEVQRINDLRNEWPDFAKVTSILANDFTPTSVNYFKGEDGIKQMSWNCLETKTELLSYTFHAFQEILGQRFLERWAEEAKMSKLRIRELHSEEFQPSLAQPGYASVKLFDMGERYQARLIPDKTVKMTHAMDIYNDVLAIYFWKDGEAFGVEIRNQLIAEMQRSMFEVFWKMAKPYKY